MDAAVGQHHALLGRRRGRHGGINTYTLENSYGNRVVVRGAGYILNNEMTDFNRKPGLTTRTGLVGTRPNVIEPGKRMLSRRRRRWC